MNRVIRFNVSHLYTFLNHTCVCFLVDYVTVLKQMFPFGQPICFVYVAGQE